MAVAPLSARAQTPSAPIFQPANATATAQARAAAATATPADANCPGGFVCVTFGQFKYALDPTCSDQHYIIGLRSEQDPQTGDDVSYVRNLNFLMAGDDSWTIVPSPEHRATGPDVGKPLGALLCAGKEGSQ